jgi:DNA-binding HxlR family transcriptional regulator
VSRTRFDMMNCAAAQALNRIGDWWTLLIVREAFYGATTFTEFQRPLGIAKNILTDRLVALVETGIFNRVQAKPGSSRYRYELTEMGRDLLPILIGLMQWGDRWIFGKGREPLVLLEAETREPIAKLTVQNKDGRALAADKIGFEPGPGATAETVARLTSA